MNLYLAEYFSDLSNPKDTMQMTNFIEIGIFDAQRYIEDWIFIYGHVEDPTGLIFRKQYDELPNQLAPCMVAYTDDTHENFCRQFLIICATEMPEAEDIADIESWNHILDSVTLVEPEDEPEIEETDGADDAD